MARGDTTDHVVYLTSRYPALSHTFILREVQGLRALGFKISTASVRKPGLNDALGVDEKEERERTFYVLDEAKHATTVVKSLVSALRTPRAFVDALALAMRGGRPGARGFLWQFFYFVEAAVLARHLKAIGAQHLHCHFADAPANVATLASALSGIPFSYTLHGPAELFEPLSWKIGMKSERAAFTVCISHFARSQCMYFTSPEHWTRLKIVHCGVRPDRYGPKRRNEGETLQLVYVGRLTAIKGLRVLIEAFLEARKVNPHIKLTLVGDGPDRELLERLSAPADDRISFRGALSQAEVAEELRNADIFVLPSFAEGVPVVLMEAMASGLPVICTSVGGVPELVAQGESGLLVPPGDVHSLVDAIVELSTDASARQRMGMAGRNTVLADFDADVEAARIGALFRGVGGDSVRPLPLEQN
jgi:glycosyltransferase involved in cell wall biosynthesis